MHKYKLHVWRNTVRPVVRDIILNLIKNNEPHCIRKTRVK